MNIYIYDSEKRTSFTEWISFWFPHYPGMGRIRAYRPDTAAFQYLVFFGNYVDSVGCEGPELCSTLLFPRTRMNSHGRNISHAPERLDKDADIVPDDGERRTYLGHPGRDEARSSSICHRARNANRTTGFRPLSLTRSFTRRVR